MSRVNIQVSILESLLRSPSRASAAAIGCHYVLNGVPPGLQLMGVNALARMPCDWAVAILEEAINDPTREYHVRRHAIRELGDLLCTAIGHGYANITRRQCSRLARAADRELTRQCAQGQNREIRAVEELCSHLSQALADGCLGQVPDF
jgi:hypothetical protein